MRNFMRINEVKALTMPYSEVCMHLGIAGTMMLVKATEREAILFKDGRRFSAPITHGEAGIFVRRPVGETRFRQTRELFVKIDAAFREGYEAFEREVEYFRTETKYTHPACQHGTSRWTDYDNICGPCENGEDYGDVAYRRAAAWQTARSAVLRSEKLYEAATLLSGAGATVDFPSVFAAMEKVLACREILGYGDVCQITRQVDCTDRDCELHYQDAPVRLAD